LTGGDCELKMTGILVDIVSEAHEIAVQQISSIITGAIEAGATTGTVVRKIGIIELNEPIGCCKDRKVRLTGESASAIAAGKYD
jgi:hypothetical protein